MSEARALWPQLQDSAQRYSACFETLAQLALAMMARRACSAKQWSFTLPSASDNAPTEVGLEKLWSTAEPLGSFLMPAWAARRGIQLMVTHIAGEKNTWADALSRNHMHAFQNRMQEGWRQLVDATFLGVGNEFRAFPEKPFHKIVRLSFMDFSNMKQFS